MKPKQEHSEQTKQIRIITFKRLPFAKLAGNFSQGRGRGGKMSPPPFKETKKKSKKKKINFQ